MKMADQQTAAGQYKQAVQGYLSVVKLQPNNADAYNKLGIAYEKLNMLSESAGAYAKSAEIYEKQAEGMVAGQPAAPAAAAAPPAVAAPQPQEPVQQAPQAVANSQSCPTTSPPGTVTRSSPPTAQTFQRAIFDIVSYDERGQVGLVFTQFDMQPTRKNTIVMNGGLSEKEYLNVPNGTVAYPIKTTYVYCVQDKWLSVRTVWKVDYVCMKDKFGDWSCPVDSTRERLDYKVTNK
ncbi:MAG TPA: tetratricopeptide repeat protein [Acidobacteriaceae bacterium]